MIKIQTELQIIRLNVDVLWQSPLQLITIAKQTLEDKSTWVLVECIRDCASHFVNCTLRNSCTTFAVSTGPIY